MERRRAEAGRAQRMGRKNIARSEGKGMQTETGRESNQRLIEDSRRTEETQ